MRREKRDDAQCEREIVALLADSQYEGHPLRAALSDLFEHYQEQLGQLERLTSISDGYQTVLRERNESLARRYSKQIRQLQKIVRISDHYQEMLREFNEALKVASTQDLLTGLPNRRLMLDRLTTEAALAERRQVLFSVALIDADYFKRINDEFGHDVGDKALISIAGALTSTLRAYDVCARWGGEEFLVLLPETLLSNALEIAERLREAVASLQLPEPAKKGYFSVSIGVAEHREQATIEDTIKRADLALYEAKHRGRNRVVAAA